jgi:hypothetical protein
MPGIDIKNIIHHELNQTNKRKIKKTIEIVFILELEKKLFNETLPSNQKNMAPKDKNAKCTGQSK